jgi:hypothetical protein
MLKQDSFLEGASDTVHLPDDDPKGFRLVLQIVFGLLQGKLPSPVEIAAHRQSILVLADKYAISCVKLVIEREEYVKRVQTGRMETRVTFLNNVISLLKY